MTGRFCAACGQRHEIRPLGFPSLTRDVLVTVLDSDARVWRTLRELVLRPGALTLAWVRGERARWLPPMRLFLVLNVLAFLVLSLQMDPIRIPEDPVRTEARAELRERIEALGDDPAAGDERRSLERALALLEETPRGQGDEELAEALALLEAALATARDETRRADLRRARALVARHAGEGEGEGDAAANGDEPVGYEIGGGARLSLGERDDLLQRIGYPRQRIQAALDRLASDPGRSFELLLERLPIVMVLLLPVLATALRVLYLFSSRPWVVHLVGLAHLHAFAFLLLLLADGFAGFGLLLHTMGLPIAEDAIGDRAFLVAFLTFPVYTLMWARRLYGHGWFGSVVLGGVITVLDLVGVAAGVVLLVIVSLILEVVFGG